MTIEEYIFSRFKANNRIVTVDEVCTALNISRSGIAQKMRGLATDFPYFRYLNGRKGYPSRLELRNGQVAKTLVDLTPDDSQDGPTIPAGQLVIVDGQGPGGCYSVQWQSGFSWATKDEIQIL